MKEIKDSDSISLDDLENITGGFPDGREMQIKTGEKPKPYGLRRKLIKDEEMDKINPHIIKPREGR